MPEVKSEAQDFHTFLADRSISPDAFARMSEEMQSYLRETWQLENHIPPEVAAPDMPRYRAPEPSGIDWSAFASSRSVLWLTAICLVLVVVAIALPRARRSASDAGFVSAKSPIPTSVPAASTPSLVPPPTVPGSGWQPISHVAGSGRTRTAAFSISGPKWRVEWMTRPASGRASDDLRVQVLRPDGTNVGPAALVRGESEGEAVLRGRGAFVLEVSSGQNYLVKVSDFRPGM